MVPGVSRPPTLTILALCNPCNARMMLETKSGHLGLKMDEFDTTEGSKVPSPREDSDNARGSSADRPGPSSGRPPLFSRTSPDAAGRKGRAVRFAGEEPGDRDGQVVIDAARADHLRLLLSALLLDDSIPSDTRTTCTAIMKEIGSP